MQRRRIQDVGLAVAFYRAKLDALAEPPQSLGQAPSSWLRIVLNNAGYAKIHPRILERLGPALTEAGIEPYPSLDDPLLPRDTRLYFFNIPKPGGLAPLGALFKTERLLEDFLVDNFSALPLFKGLKLRRRQFPLEQGQRIDLLCEERGTRRLVGVELKHHGPDTGLVNQMSRYMAALTNLANEEGRDAGARGMVITGQPDLNISAKLRAMCTRERYDVSWHLYRASIKLDDAPGWEKA